MPSAASVLRGVSLALIPLGLVVLERYCMYIVSEVSSGYPYTEKTDMYTLGCVMYKILGKSTKPELQKYEERPQLLRNQFGGVVPKWFNIQQILCCSDSKARISARRLVYIVDDILYPQLLAYATRLFSVGQDISFFATPFFAMNIWVILAGGFGFFLCPTGSAKCTPAQERILGKANSFLSLSLDKWNGMEIVRYCTGSSIQRVT